MPFLPPNQQRQSTEGKEIRQITGLESKSKQNTIIIVANYVTKQVYPEPSVLTQLGG